MGELLYHFFTLESMTFMILKILTSIVYVLVNCFFFEICSACALYIKNKWAFHFKLFFSHFWNLGPYFWKYWPSKFIHLSLITVQNVTDFRKWFGIDTILESYCTKKPDLKIAKKVNFRPALYFFKNFKKFQKLGKKKYAFNHHHEDDMHIEKSYTQPRNYE